MTQPADRRLITEAAGNATYADKSVETTKADAATVDAELAQMRQTVRATIVQSTPATFLAPAGYTNPLITTATRDAQGRYTANHTSIDSLHVPGSGRILHVDPVDGINTTAGGRDGSTRELAYKTVGYALQQGGANTSEVIIGGGLYDRADGGQLLRSPNVTLRAWEGERVALACADRPTWTQHAGNCYSASVATVNAVFDMMGRNFVAGEDPDLLTKADSIQEVIDTPRTWFHVSGIVYVHRADGSAPDADVYCSRTIAAMRFDNPTMTGPVSFFNDGVEIWGGTGTNMTAPAGHGAGSRVLGRNARYAFSGNSNGISIWGMEYALHIDSRADRNYLDGFNYHVNGGQDVTAVEVRCDGIYNGGESGSQNGSTIHGTCRIARVGGNYVSNLGANLADVNDSQAWIVGSRVGGYLGDGSLDNGLDILGGNMWLDQVVSTSPESVRLDTTATAPVVRARDSILLGTSTATAW